MTHAASNSRCDTASRSQNPWPNCLRLPRHARAVLSALHLTAPEYEDLAALSTLEWRAALEFAHQSTIGLDLRRAARHVMPEWVREELDGCAERNAERARRLRATYSEMRARLGTLAVPFAALKGFTHASLFGSQADERQQADIDLYVPPERALAARDMFREWGYEEWEGVEGLPTDHLPAMIRKTGWQWSGDYFDVEAPCAIEIHVQFWNEKLECLRAPGVEKFWERREWRICGGVELPALAPADALGYASLHLLKHLFQDNVRPSHVLEIARFLDGRALDDRFWSEWRALHSPELRRLEAVAFRLAQCWFGCELAEAAEAEIAAQPEAVHAWFEEFAVAPAVQRFEAAKNELWLHLSLLESPVDAWSVARRRLLPLRIPGPVSGICTPARDMSFAKRVEQQADRARYTLSRARRHAVALPRAVVTGAHWWFGAQFWRFLGAAALVNFAWFIFTLLYNLFLLNGGYREDFIGTLSSASSAATMVGAVPAAWALRRFGLHKALLAVIGASACILTLRTLAHGAAPLIFLACAWGLVFAAWAVLLAPAIAAAVPEKRRPGAFSVFFASMISTGVAANWIGGRLPQFLQGYKPALLLSAGLAAIALLPALRWRPAAVRGANQPGRIWPHSSFIKRYLAAFAVWQLATGAFNPFLNVYFARLGYSSARIGSLFSGAQIAQVGSLLLAPLVIRRAGLIRAIVLMMAGTALGLFWLGAFAGPVLAYGWYVSLQWMSEPGLNSLVMNNVKEAERNGASSLNYLVAFGAQTVAAVAAGHLYARFGYGPVLAGAGGLALVSAALFRGLLRR